MNRRIVFRQPHGGVVTLTQTETKLERLVAPGSGWGWPFYRESLGGPMEHHERVWDRWEAFERRIGSEEEKA